MTVSLINFYLSSFIEDAQASIGGLSALAQHILGDNQKMAQ